jgi:hypothetical protein
MKLDSDWSAILDSIAPVAPQAVLTKISGTPTGSNGGGEPGASAWNRKSLMELLKLLAFEPTMFDEAAMTLTRFIAAEAADNSSNSAAGFFRELFHLYLSGTRARIEQRIELVRRLAKSKNGKQRRCAMLALDGLLETNHFSSSNSFDFGARPRDYGWQPHTGQDTLDWFERAIDLAIELKDIPETSSIFARHIRFLWWSSGCFDHLEVAAPAFSIRGVWIDGWPGFRMALRFDGKRMPDDIRERLERIVDRLKPVDLVDLARVHVLGHLHGVYDDLNAEGNDITSISSAFNRASEATVEIGKTVAESPHDLDILLPEIISAEHAPRAYEFGRGLALGSIDLVDTWSALKAAYAIILPQCRNPTILGGFLAEAHARNATFVALALDAAMNDRDLAPLLPYLQARAGLDKTGIGRLRTAIAQGVLSSDDFRALTDGSIKDAPSSDLRGLLTDVSDLPGGVPLAIEMLYMYLFCHQENAPPIELELIDVGRYLLRQLDFDNTARRRVHTLESLVRQCLAGHDGEEVAREICRNIRSTLDSASPRARHLAIN